VLKLIPLVLLALLFVASLAKPASIATATGNASAANFARAALLVVFAMQGFEIVPVPAGHTRASRRAVPVATLGSLLFSAALYVLLHAACVRALPSLAVSRAPLVDAAAFYGGPGVARLVAAGANISALGIAFGMLAMSPRYLAALGHSDRSWGWVAAEDARGVPRRALVITLAVIVLIVMIGQQGTELLALSSVAVLTQYGVTAAALGVLALRRQRGRLPRHALLSPLALVAAFLLVRAASWRELGVAASVMGLGAVLRLARRFLRAPANSAPNDYPPSS
jgi:APA family basic amino acid/polyamine antiporter